jgi:small-conductance mechanosensitive channel
MTDTKSLSERLRKFSVVVYNPDGSQGAYHPPICTQAADALDDRDAAIVLLVSGRSDVIKQQAALLAQAAAALEAADEAINPPDRSGISMDTWNKRLKASTTTIREALAAIRAKEHP